MVRIVNGLSLFFWESIALTSTLVMRLLLRIIGVSAPKSVFYGLATVRCSSGATISIGEGNIFRSMATSNLIGINRPCILSAHESGAVLRTGKCCGFSGTVIGCFKEITLGDRVRCGANTLITDSDWHTDDPRIGPAAPVRIDDNVWLGEGVKVLKGVSIGTNSIIGAGSVVTSDIPANMIAAGNPCRPIRQLDAAPTTQGRKS